MDPNSYTPAQERLARIAKALGHPARIAIMDYLQAQDTCCFGDLHEVLPLSKATVSQHLKALKEAGLIQGEIEPPRVRYCINRSAWSEALALFDSFFSRCSCRSRCSCH